MLFDKWQLAPLRLFNLFALLVLAMHYAPWLAKHLPRVRALETMGAASLPVFCAHLVLALLALALFGAPTPTRSVWIDVGIVVVSFAVLYGVALLSQELDRQAAARRKGRVKGPAGPTPPSSAALPQ
jgi:peptidoglycan/LPS O-acetylase OafA/YrhL